MYFINRSNRIILINSIYTEFLFFKRWNSDKILDRQIKEIITTIKFLNRMSDCSFKAFEVCRQVSNFLSRITSQSLNYRTNNGMLGNMPHSFTQECFCSCYTFNRFSCCKKFKKPTE